MQILYATDGSADAQAGARFLARLILDTRDQVRVLTVAERNGAEQALETARQALAGSAAQIVTEIREGNAAEEILKAAEEQPTDVIVVGTRGISAIARFVLGSVAERVAQHAVCPVLLARPLHHNLERVVVAMDGSDGAGRAAAWLQTFPLPPTGEIRLVTVVTPMDAVSSSRMALLPPFAQQMVALAQQEQDEAQKNLEASAASFAGNGRSIATEIRQNDPASGLIASVEEHTADLIVVGAQGLTGLDRFLIGSVSEKIMRHAPCSVLVVK